MNLEDSPYSKSFPPKRFCASPWSELVVRIDGSCYPCCRSDRTFGNLRHNNLAAVWNSRPARQFRHEVATGEFPSQACRACFESGKQTPLSKVFHKPWSEAWKDFCEATEDQLPSGLPRVFYRLIQEFDGAICLDVPPRAPNVLLQLLENTSRLLKFYRLPTNSVHRLIKVVRSCISYWRNDTEPPIVAPFRQPHLVSVCNARCVHCIGLYTGEIQKGLLVGGKLYKHMSTELVTEAAARREDVLAFFMNGSELFLAKGWADLYKHLTQNGTIVHLSTNAMLLGRSERRILRHGARYCLLNISLDGGKSHTIERIRKGVRYEQFAKNVKSLLREWGNTGQPISFSYIVLQSNFRELPDAISLIDELRGESQVAVRLDLQTLNWPGALKDYAAFYERETIPINLWAEFEHVIHHTTILSKQLMIPLNAEGCGVVQEIVEGSRESAGLGAVEI